MSETVDKTVPETVPEASPEPVSEPGEYLDENGVPHCARCGKPLRAKLTNVHPLLSVEYVEYYVECPCRRAIRERREREQQEKQRVQALREKRMLAWNDWKSSRFYRRDQMLPSFDRDDSGDSEAARICRNYADNWERMKEENCGLLLTGPLGTGKTFYAGAIMRRLMDTGVHCVMVSVPQLADTAMNGHSSQVMWELNGFDLVVLDDLGTERCTDFALEQLELFTDARYMSGKPVIVTTNLTKAELDDQSDRRRARIYDRIKEMACVPVLLTGQSRRSAAARDKAKRMRALLDAGRDAEKNEPSGTVPNGS